MLHTIFFDLDNTLYSRKSGIWEAIGSRINLFMTDVLDIPEEDVFPLRSRFRKDFSTTLMGLKSMFEVDVHEYLVFVHDVNLSELLADDGRLEEMLSTISKRKIIFTNSDTMHANRVLEFFNVRDQFDLIIDVIAMQPFVKPQSESYKIALNLAKIDSADGCMFIDDMLENVEQAQVEGFYSVWIGDHPIDYPTIPDVFHLPAILQKLDKDNHQ